MHESRTFFTKGIVSNIFFDFIYNLVPSVSTVHTIIAQVYNFIYTKVFTHIWISRCTQVIAHEQTRGIINRIKRSRWRPRQRPSIHSRTLPSIIPEKDTMLIKPWVKWFTASIRQGSSWLTYAFSPQADKFGSFTTSALNSFTSNINNRVPIIQIASNSVSTFSNFFSV